MELTPRPDPGLALRGVRVLVVEDDAILLFELEHILNAAGAESVTACRSVGAALAALRDQSVSAAVLDVRIGAETVTPVARRLDECGTPFVFYTGQVADDPVVSAWPGHLLISKPASPRAIVAAVAGAARGWPIHRSGRTSK